eukprot:14149622-Alexandrium_andersonii.AAC.1
MGRWRGWLCMAGLWIGGSFRARSTARRTLWPRTDRLAGLAGSSAPPFTEPGGLAAGCRRDAPVRLGRPGC